VTKIGQDKKKLKMKSRCVMLQTYSQGECKVCESVREELPLFSTAISFEDAFRSSNAPKFF
jgi:hypothetical protein